jgi:hypothetical protein
MMKTRQVLASIIAISVIAVGIAGYLVVSRPPSSSNSVVNSLICQGTETVVQLSSGANNGTVTLFNTFQSYTTTATSAGTVGQTTVRTSIDRSLTGPDINDSEGMTCTYTK